MTPSYAQQWSYFEAAGGINLPAKWDRTTGSAASTVAVLDTGLTAHPDLDGRRVAGYNFITSTTLSQDGDGRDLNPADVGDHGCNGSGSSSWHGTHVAGTIGAASDNGSGVRACGVAYQNAINDEVARGAVVVAAAGNSNIDAVGATPAGCNGVIAVGATTHTGARANYSNCGSKVALSCQQR